MEGSLTDSDRAWAICQHRSICPILPAYPRASGVQGSVESVLLSPDSSQKCRGSQRGTRDVRGLRGTCEEAVYRSQGTGTQGCPRQELALRPDTCGVISQPPSTRTPRLSCCEEPAQPISLYIDSLRGFATAVGKAANREQSRVETQRPVVFPCSTETGRRACDLVVRGEAVGRRQRCL